MGEGVLLCKPTSYMNLSGEPVSALARYYKIEPSEILVVLDDVALPLGKLRLRSGGSAGGHNGLKSIIAHLGTTEIARVRIGIGGAAGSELSDHVLGRFSSEEMPVLNQSLDRAIEAIDFAQTRGMEAAMNQFN